MRYRKSFSRLLSWRPWRLGDFEIGSSGSPSGALCAVWGRGWGLGLDEDHRCGSDRARYRQGLPGPLRGERGAWRAVRLAGQDQHGRGDHRLGGHRDAAARRQGDRRGALRRADRLGVPAGRADRREPAGARAALAEDVPLPRLLRSAGRGDADDLRRRYRPLGHRGQGVRPAGSHPARREVSRQGQRLRLDALPPDARRDEGGGRGVPGARLPGDQVRLGRVRPRHRARYRARPGGARGGGAGDRAAGRRRLVRHDLRKPLPAALAEGLD